MRRYHLPLNLFSTIQEGTDHATRSLAVISDGVSFTVE